jgi:CheY-like chemotaxis protein
MSLVGNLEDLGLGEILQIVSLSRKSGILTLHSRRREGKIIFRRGLVIRAMSQAYLECLGDLLVQKRLINLPIFRQALSIQESDDFKESLGTILVNRFDISVETIEEVVRNQIENIVYSFFDWTEGTFGFELQENVDSMDSIDIDPLQFSLDQGINPQYLAMEGSRLIDEKRHHDKKSEDDNALSHENQSLEENVDIAFNLQDTQRHHDLSHSVAQTKERPVLVLVDDNALVRQAIGGSIQEYGYDVIQCARIEESLLKLGALSFDGRHPTALIDLIMPEIDGTGMLGGMELLVLIKKSFPDIPILVMADYHNSEAERKVRRMGFRLIMKPRKNEIGDSALLELFIGKLLSELNRVKSGGGAFDFPENVNLGDELRQEMGEESALSSGPLVPSTGISLLKGMLKELNDPALGGGIILLVLRFASEFMNRAVIFSVRKEEIVGLGQFGINRLADSVVRNLKIPIGESSLFSEVIETHGSIKKRPDDNSWIRYLLGKLGGGIPAEVYIGPIVSDGKVVAMLYGDNLPEKKPIGDTVSLEIFLSQAGLAMEKALLQSKLKSKRMEGM